MKSGLEGRNNESAIADHITANEVSMKSGLEGRNNLQNVRATGYSHQHVSMKSGLEGRNNDLLAHR